VQFCREVSITKERRPRLRGSSKASDPRRKGRQRLFSTQEKEKGCLLPPSLPRRRGQEDRKGA